MPIASTDTESFYAKGCDIKSLGTYHYLRHPDVKVYLHTIVTDGGKKLATTIAETPWSEITGPEWVWLHHNAAHEDDVYRSLKEKGEMPDVAPGQVYCTADLAAFLGAPRSLAGAS